MKDPSQYRLIGTSMKRLDTASKVNGTATFGLDVKRPGMLYASLERCPVFGGKVASFDATKAKAVARRQERGADFERRGRSGRQHLGRGWKAARR